MLVKTAIGVGIAAASGAGAAYAIDKLNIGTANQRNFGLLAAGVAAAALLAKMTPAAASIGAGIAAVGLTRAVVLHQNAAAAPAAIRGLGTGEGLDDTMQGPFDQIGLVQQGGIDGVFDHQGNSEVDGVYDEIGMVVHDYS